MGSWQIQAGRSEFYFFFFLRSLNKSLATPATMARFKTLHKLKPGKAIAFPAVNGFFTTQEDKQLDQINKMGSSHSPPKLKSLYLIWVILK